MRNVSQRLYEKQNMCQINMKVHVYAMKTNQNPNI